MKKMIAGILVFTILFLCAGFVGAATDELAPFPSTNELNAAMEVPGRIGQVAPYVEQIGAYVGSVDLAFYNYAPGLAFFEYRLDGVPAGSTPHPNPRPWISSNDTIHPGVAVTTGNETTRSFAVNNMVEVRLALGGERDWDFGWTAFYALQPTPPSFYSDFNFGGSFNVNLDDMGLFQQWHEDFLRRKQQGNTAYSGQGN